jgi:4-amino-4-deoxy-L-arabinose transferase-like glycosyltransferase
VTAFSLVAAIACLADLLVIWIAPGFGISRDFGGLHHDGYLELARNLLAGNGFVFEPGGSAVLHRPPLYPLLLIPVVALPEPLQRPALIVAQSFLLGGTAAIVWKIGASLFDAAVARLAVLIMLLDPWLTWVVKNPMSIVLQVFLYTTFSWLLLYSFLPGSNNRPSQEKGIRLRQVVLLGLNAGALALAHGTMILTCGALLLSSCLWFWWKADYRSVGRVLVAGLLMALVIAPWTLRNWKSSGLLIPVVGNSGFTYFMGNARWQIGESPVRSDEEQWETAVRYSGVDIRRVEIDFAGNTDSTLEAEFNRRMIRHIRTHPDEFLLKFTLNSVAYYFPLFDRWYLGAFAPNASSQSRNRWDIPRAAAITVFHLVLWTLCLAGVGSPGMRGRRLRAWFGILALIVVFSIAYFPFVVFVGHSQYVLPTIPLLSVLAAVGLKAIRGQVGRLL